MIFTL